VIEERTVESWSELQETLFEGSWNEPLGRHRSDYAFRGRERAGDDLSTSLARLGGRPVELERHLVRNFRKYAGRDNVPDDSVWNWLALGQHHGLPTRLLDWTYSPYVALHFATASVERFDRDGAVWMIDYVRVHEQLPEKLREALDAEGANVFTTEMLAEVAPRVRDLDGLSGDGFALFVEPPSFDARIVNQYALFSLLSRADASLDDWLEQRDGLASRLVIPAELKWEIRDKLDQANVTERVLFPGLDGLSRWVARYYAPRDAGARAEFDAGPEKLTQG
jgi:FRG domain